MSIRNVKRVDETIKVQLCAQDREKLMISEYHRIYFAYRNTQELGKELYKLHRTYTSNMENEKEFCWIAMWNSVAWTAMKHKDSFSNINVAIEFALKAGYKVVQANFDDLGSLVYLIENE